MESFTCSRTEVNRCVDTVNCTTLQKPLSSSVGSKEHDTAAVAWTVSEMLHEDVAQMSHVVVVAFHALVAAKLILYLQMAKIM